MSVVKGHIIDEHCPIKGELVEYNGNVYSCNLNQTDIETNKNKFYIIQLIKNGSSYTLFTRWGRLGEPGKPVTDTYSDESSARVAFEKQFRTKTGNSFATKNFIKKPNKYFLSDVGYEEEMAKVDIPKQLKVPDSKLPERTQKLVTMLTDIQMMKNALITLDIDTKKLPLGKIKQSQLKLAEDVLDNIEKIIKQNANSDELVGLSSNFYTYLPMASFGRRKPPVVNTDEMVQKYRDIIDELTNIAINVQITENVKTDEHPIDAAYKNVNTIITPLDKNSKMWLEIQKYVENTHGSTHDAKLDIVDIFEIEQNGKRKLFEDHCKGIDNHTFLFHGCPSVCTFSIFSRDFMLDPSKLKDVNVQIAGKMFGYGIYFADCATKSFNYTRAQSSNNIGCLILTKVALGKQLQKSSADCSINNDTLKKQKCHSTKGVGKWEPSSYTTIDNVKIPNGKLHVANNNSQLRYNEHIIYNINQQNISYLIIVKNNGGYGGY
jgi:predicted DNA-binding WGR domain protein